MNEDEAKKLVESTFSGAYNEDKFRRFIVELLGGSNSFKPLNETLDSEQFAPKSFRDKIVSFKRFAEFEVADRKAIDVLAVGLKDFSTLERARTSQRNFIARLLEDSVNKYAALVAFYTEENPEWRFSLVQVQYKREEGDIKKELTPAHRSSFLVGDKILKHTAKRQLNELLLSNKSMSLDVLKKAFSVEPVTDKFFNEYIELYYENLLPHLQERMKESSKFKNMDVDLIEIEAEKFTIHLLGQLVFLYFLQKKHFLGAPEEKHFDKGEPDFLHNLYREGGFDNFYNEKLYYLLHDALAIKRPSTHSYRKKLGGKIPYLNGGLFEAFDDNDWRKKLNISNDIFEKIFKFFDTYNFTVHEDEPLENEVAIDPEMLGKVFENLIPERKGSGTYYTPREIVYYMCQESLIDYLYDCFEDTDSRDDSAIYKAIEKFVIACDGDEINLSDFIKQSAKEIDKALQDVRICDPAIGSGAFPVAMMLEIVRLRMALDKTIDREEPLTAYQCKLYCIENSLYGVDTESLAVDIARLRFWLSLTIEATSKTQDDHVVPLPNLDYKIIEYDAILRTYYKDNDDSKSFDFQWLDKLEELKRKYFSERDKEQKLKLKESIESEIQALLKNGEDFKVHFSEIFHGEDAGFDIVLANPPYIQLQRNGGELAKLYTGYGYGSFTPTGDIYTLFYERAIDLLKQGGRLAYITSNKWMRTDYGKNIRKIFTEKTTPIALVDLGSNAFDTATVDSNIFITRKGQKTLKDEENIIFRAATLHNHKNQDIDLYQYMRHAEKIPLPENDEQWRILSKAERTLLEKIESKGKTLEDLKVKIFRGIGTGYNKAFVIDKEIKKRLIAEDSKSEEIIKPVLRGQSLKKWHPDWQDEWLIASHNGYSNISRIDIVKDYPAIHKWLLKCEEESEEVKRVDKITRTLSTRDDQGSHWTNLRSCVYQGEFEKAKIIYPELNQGCSFIYDTDNFYLLNSAYMMTSDLANLKNLTAFLNSNISQFWLSNNCTNLGNRGIRMLAMFLNELPIYEKINDCDKLGEITDAITKGEDIQKHEARLNQILYDLYELTDAEIKILEKTT